MKIGPMFFGMIISSLLCSYTPAFSQEILDSADTSQESSTTSIFDLEHDPLNPVQPIDRCDYIRDPYECQATYGCDFSRILNRCVSIGGGGFDQCEHYAGDQYSCRSAGCDYNIRTGECRLNGGGDFPPPSRQCSQYQGNARRCESAGCNYDYRSGRCSAGGLPPLPDRCEQFFDDQYGCQRAGCSFDFRTGQCFGGFQPQPRDVICIAVDRGHEEHRGGHEGYGRTESQARQSALSACTRYHGQCRIQSCRQGI